MKYYGKIIGLDRDNEHEVMIDFGEVTLTCFIDSAISDFQIGDIKLLDINFMFNEGSIQIDSTISDDLEIITRLGKSYSYKIQGFFYEDTFTFSNLVIQDEIFTQYSFYEKALVKIHIDRLGISIS
ncbi:hypothetical protein [Wohlfahrtiimonas larvae]|nr:hypothetical protein [Wohlfahrtiimonas larvae]